MVHKKPKIMTRNVINLTAASKVIRRNIMQMFGSIQNASDATGLTRQTWYTAVAEGRISDKVAGRLYRLDIDPKELVKKPEKVGNRYYGED